MTNYNIDFEQWYSGMCKYEMDSRWDVRNMKTNGMLKQPFFLSLTRKCKYIRIAKISICSLQELWKKIHPPDDKERDLLRSKIGQILWVDRPDGMFNASSLASAIKTATVQTLHEANFIV